VQPRLFRLNPASGVPIYVQPVLDLTGLTGRYDMALDLTIYAGRETQPEDMASLVLTAVQEQLGLKLEARKGPLRFLSLITLRRPPQGINLEPMVETPNDDLS
jgi:uncharacterized protein (TIGR03435 family)